MRALVVTNLFPFPGQPTRGVFNYQMFLHLPRRIELLVLVPVPWRAWRRSCHGTRSVEGVSVRYFRFFYPPRIARCFHHVWMWWSLRVAGLSEIDGFAPECVLGSFLYPDGSLALRLSTRYGVALVLKAHGSDVNLKAVDPCIRRRIDASVSRAHTVIAVADSLADRMRQLNLPARCIRVIENGVDLDRFKVRDRNSSRLQLGLPVKARIILYVGNLKREKGCLDLYEAATQVFRRTPDAMLVYVGNGECRQELLERVRQSGLQNRVHVVGSRSHDEIPLYFGAADTLVLPSHAEGLPNVVLEAFASGRPVVGTEVGAMPALLRDGGGALVPVRDTTALAHAITLVLDSPFDPEALRARTTARSWHNAALQTAEVLESAVVSGKDP